MEGLAMCQPFFITKTPLRMYKLLIPILGIFLYQCSPGTADTAQPIGLSQQVKLNNGVWRFAMELGPADLPFSISFENINTENPNAYLSNQDEKIEITEISIIGDSIHLRLPVFPSILSARIESPTLISGQWINESKENYTIPFVAEHDKKFRFTPNSSSKEISSQYKVDFTSEKGSEWPAVLDIKNSQGTLSGTFLTETGDFRYLAGNIINESIFLSTFDGSHAFYFSADISGDSLVNGIFLSGTHYKATWTAIADSSFGLRKPQELTFLNEGYNHVDFRLPNQDGDTVTWNDLNLDNKVVILDIMGSWCPNCMDANKAIHELTSHYPEDQFEIVTVAFELTKDLAVAKKRFTKMQNNSGFDSHEFLFAGYADKKRAKEVFPMLNHIMSYPTLIFIDKNRNVRQIYTGFYGPGTGKHYDNFMEKTGSLLEDMISEKS